MDVSDEIDEQGDGMEYWELAREWDGKADLLDEMGRDFIIKEDFESRRRVVTKAGVYRACASDLRRRTRGV